MNRHRHLSSELPASLSLSKSGGGLEALTREDLRTAFLLFVSHCGLLATLSLSLHGKARTSVTALSSLGLEPQAAD